MIRGHRSLIMAAALIGVASAMPSDPGAPTVGINLELPPSARGVGSRGRNRGGSTSNLQSRAEKKRRNKIAKKSRNRNRR